MNEAQEQLAAMYEQLLKIEAHLTTTSFLHKDLLRVNDMLVDIGNMRQLTYKYYSWNIECKKKQY